jgi:hypothetical protein
MVEQAIEPQISALRRRAVQIAWTMTTPLFPADP